MISRIKLVMKKLLPKKIISVIKTISKLLWGTYAKKRRALNRISRFYRRSKNLHSPKTMLFFSRGSEFMITFEAFLALALRIMGEKCVFVVCDGLNICNFSSHKRHTMNCQSCFSGYKIPQKLGFEIHKLSEFISKDSERFILPDSLDECINYNFNNIKVGEYLKPSILRYFMVSDFNYLNEKEVNKIYHEFIISAIKVYYAVENIIERFSPEKVFMFNGRYSQMRVAYETFNKFDILCTTYEALNAPRGQYWILSNREPVMNFNLSQEWKVWKNNKSPQPYWNKYKTTRENKIRIKEDFDPPFDISKADLFLTNIRWELSIIALRSPFESMERCITETIDYYIRKNKKLIIRIHPADSSEYEGDIAPGVYEYLSDKYGQFPENIWIIKPEEKIDSYTLVNKCKRVIVWTSTIGYETACEGRRPIVTAKVHYSGKGFTRDIISKDDYFKALEEDDRLSKEQVELANRYASYFLLRKKIPLSFFKTPITYGSTGFNILEYHKDLREYNPYHNEVLRFVCDNIVNNEEFVLPDSLVAKTYDQHIFPMLNKKK